MKGKKYPKIIEEQAYIGRRKIALILGARLSDEDRKDIGQARRLMAKERNYRTLVKRWRRYILALRKANNLLLKAGSVKEEKQK